MVSIPAALGQNVDHAPQRLAVLGLKTTRLDLYFLNEIEIDAIAQ
jgi:hypothetical protein